MTRGGPALPGRRLGRTLVAGVLVLSPWWVVAQQDGGPDVVGQAREWLRRGQPREALRVLEAAGRAKPEELAGPHAGVLAMAAGKSGNLPVAVAALERLRGDAAAPPLARLALEARWLGWCPAGCQAAPPPVPGDAVPVPLAARYLRALTPVDGAAALAWAGEVQRGTSWKREDVAPAERAGLLAALHAAHVAAGAKGAAGAAALALVAWETLPAEPALAGVIQPLDDAKLLAQLGPERAVAHLRGLEVANRNDQVVAYGALLCRDKVVEDGAVCPALPEPLRCPVAFSVGKAQRQARRYGPAEAILSVVALACPEQAPRARLLLARVMIAQKNGGPRAVRVLEELVTRHKDSPLADDALVLAGETSDRNGRPQEAARYWQRALAEYPGGDMRADASWWLAWQALAARQDGEAQRRLAEITGATQGKDVVAWRRAAYWAARRAGDDKAATAGMAAVLAVSPFSYEASLARGWLKARGLPVPALPAAPARTTLGPPPPVTDPSTLAALHLQSVGLDDDAVVLFWDSPVFTTADGAGELGLYVVARLLELGDAPTASRWTRRVHAAALRAPPSPASGRVWRLAYPEAYLPEVEAAAREFGLPVSLLLALSREESAFDAAVTSWAGAVGLMQLMPATAEMEGRALKLGAVPEVALRDPALNARLGAAHLRRHLRKFNGNAALALAAYNAGPGNVDRWLARHGAEELDGLVERIPITETRGYVKRVLESFCAYGWLRGEPPLALPPGALDRVVE